MSEGGQGRLALLGPKHITPMVLVRSVKRPRREQKPGKKPAQRKSCPCSSLLRWLECAEHRYQTSSVAWKPGLRL